MIVGIGSSGFDVKKRIAHAFGLTIHVNKPDVTKNEGRSGRGHLVQAVHFVSEETGIAFHGQGLCTGTVGG